MTHDDGVSNPSANPSFDEILAGRLSRRDVLRGGLAAAGVAFLGSMGVRGARPAAAADLFGFQSVPVSTADKVVVPPGYTAQVLYAWGDPISDGPEFKADATNTADEQARQAGMHHDGMHFFPLP